MNKYEYLNWKLTELNVSRKCIQEKIYLTNKHEKIFNSFVNKEMQIKTKTRYNFFTYQIGSDKKNFRVLNTGKWEREK